ncbi:STAS domain-containing protein [Streptomyces globisporus]|uniref:STAS domain-containing protein n=1 Tax=Streptomyces globisporus TaxID=1908 RepID=UPI003791D670
MSTSEGSFSLISPKPGVLVFSVAGDVDIDDSDLAEEWAERVRLNDGELTVVDLSESTFMSSDFLNILLGLRQDHEDRGRVLVLVASRHAAARSPLETTGLSRFFTIAPDLASALSLGRHRHGSGEELKGAGPPPSAAV